VTNPHRGAPIVEGLHYVARISPNPNTLLLSNPILYAPCGTTSIFIDEDLYVGLMWHWMILIRMTAVRATNRFDRTPPLPSFVIQWYYFTNVKHLIHTRTRKSFHCWPPRISSVFNQSAALRFQRISHSFSPASPAWKAYSSAFDQSETIARIFEELPSSSRHFRYLSSAIKSFKIDGIKIFIPIIKQHFILPIQMIRIDLRNE